MSMVEKAATASPRAGTHPAPRRRLRQQRGAIAIFITPFLILFAIVFVVPIAFAMAQSLFTRKNSALGFGDITTVFVGLDNYVKVLEDPAFWAALGRIALFGIVQVPIMLGIAVLLALLLDSVAARWVSFYRIVYFLPYAIPGVIAAVLWAYLYSPTLSPIVAGLRAIGLDPDFLGPGTVLWSIANITTWSWVGYNMLIMLAALQSIPREHFEAARIDGASEFAIAMQIKLPQIRPALVLTGTLSIIGTIQLFNEPKVLQSISTNVTSDYVPTMLALQTAFRDNNFNYAAAISVVIALIAGVLSLIYYRLTSRYEQ